MKDLMKSLLSADGDISSKRVTGIFLVIIYVLIFTSSYFVELSITQVGMADQMLYLGGILLGLGLGDKFGK